MPGRTLDERIVDAEKFIDEMCCQMKHAIRDRQCEFGWSIEHVPPSWIGMQADPLGEAEREVCITIRMGRPGSLRDPIACVRP
jgi:hypothetical protein